VLNDRVCFLCMTFCSHYDDVTGRWTHNTKHVREKEQKTMSLTCRGPRAVKQVLPPEGGVDGPSPGGSKFVSGGENSTPTGWLDKPLEGREGKHRGGEQRGREWRKGRGEGYCTPLSMTSSHCCDNNNNKQFIQNV